MTQQILNTIGVFVYMLVWSCSWQITLFSAIWTKELTKDIKNESADLPARSSLEYDSSHKKDIVEGSTDLNLAVLAYIFG
jgi:hypothetical protein